MVSLSLHLWEITRAVDGKKMRCQKLSSKAQKVRHRKIPWEEQSGLPGEWENGQ